MPRLTPKQMLAADLFGYSYAHYAEHAEEGHERFTRLMLEDIDLLEQAEQQSWDASRVAQALLVEAEDVPDWQRAYREVKEIADAPTPAEAFRRAVRISIRRALEEGLAGEKAIEGLVTQVCYHAADLGFRLDMERSQLSDCSEELREEPD